MARQVDRASEDTVTTILDVTEALIRDHGAEAVSFRRVGIESKVAVGTIRYYFASKTDLLEACLDRYHDRLVVFEHDWHTHLDSGDDFDAALVGGVQSIFDAIGADPEFTRLRLSLTLKDGALSKPRRTSFREPSIRRLSKLVVDRIGIDAKTARFQVDLMMRTVGLYAVMSDEELMSVTDTATGIDARAAVRVQLGLLVNALFFSAR